MVYTVFAVIVTFNPDINELNFIISKLIEKHVNKIIIVDNNSDNYEYIKSLESSYPIVLLRMDKNYGVGRAYNVAVDFIKEKECYNNKDCSNIWVLILDQDAKPLNNFDPRTVLEKLPKEEKIGGVTINIENSMILRNYSEDFYVVAYFSNAGCLFPLSTLLQLRFNEDLFLDRVDFDFYFKMKKKKLLTLGYKEQMLDHRPGKIMGYVQNKSAIKTIQLLNFLSPTSRKYKSNNGTVKIAIIQKPFRNYLIIRNNAYIFIRNIHYLDRFFKHIFILEDIYAFIQIWNFYGFFKALKLFLRANIIGVVGCLKKDNKRFIEKDFTI